MKSLLSVLALWSILASWVVAMGINGNSERYLGYLALTIEDILGGPYTVAPGSVSHRESGLPSLFEYLVYVADPQNKPPIDLNNYSGPRISQPPDVANPDLNKLDSEMGSFAKSSKTYPLNGRALPDRLFPGATRYEDAMAGQGRVFGRAAAAISAGHPMSDRLNNLMKQVTSLNTEIAKRRALEMMNHKGTLLTSLQNTLGKANVATDSVSGPRGPWKYNTNYLNIHDTLTRLQNANNIGRDEAVNRMRSAYRIWRRSDPAAAKHAIMQQTFRVLSNIRCALKK